MMYNAVVFDLDGTLVDSVVDIALAASKALEYWKVTLGSDYLEKESPYIQHARFSLGYGLTQSIVTLAKEYIPHWDTMDQKTKNRGIHIAHNFYSDNPIVYTTPFDGVVEMLRQLTARNTIISILSNKDDTLVQKVVAKLFHTITWHTITGACAGQSIKPDANAFFNVIPTHSSAVMVGDLDVDVQTAINAKAPFIGAGWGYYDASIRADTHVLCDTPHHVVEWMGRNNV